jgi:hypothetical protein
LDATVKGHTGLASYYTERGETPGGVDRFRLGIDGPNEITQKRRSPLLEFARYFWAPIPWMIEAAGPAFWTQ